MTDIMSKERYGFYSVEAEKNGYGVFLYETETGEAVAVTCTSFDEEGSDYLWSDKVFKGKVVKYIRTICKRSRSS